MTSIDDIKTKRASCCCLPLILSSIFPTSLSAPRGFLRCRVLIGVCNAIPYLFLPLGLHDRWLALIYPQKTMRLLLARRLLSAALISSYSCAEGLGKRKDQIVLCLHDAPLAPSSCFPHVHSPSSAGISYLKRKQCPCLAFHISVFCGLGYK